MKRSRTSIAKITRPKLPKVYPRERLFRSLGSNRPCPLTWISGPPGSGKTTLVASYLNARKLPCLWYHVDEGDADPATFFYYMGLGAGKAAPRYKRPLPLFAPEYGLGIPTFARRYFENLYSRLKPPYVLVFDNYQELPSKSLTHEIIRMGLSALPEGIRAFIMSRSEPAEVFAEMKAGRLMEVIGWDALKLEIDEARGIVEQLLQKSLSEDVVQEMCGRTDGWAAGVVLLAEQAKTGHIETLLQGSRTLKEIFDYFAAVILEQTEPETRAFLEKTSVFRKFTPDMAKDLTHNPRAGEILSDLNRGNYFTQRHVSQAQVYQYHNLFREFLLERASVALPSDELRGIRHHAARLCEEAGQSEDAVELFLEAGARDDATRLILRQAPAMIAQGRGKTLAGWIGTIPEASVRVNPHLLFWKGICDLPFSLPQSRQSLEHAFALFDARGDLPGCLLAWSGIVDSILYAWDDLHHLDPWIAWLDGHRSAISLSPGSDIEAIVTISMVGALTHRQPEHPDMRLWIERAFRVLRSGRDVNSRIRAGTYAGFYLSWVGDFALMGEVMEEIRRIARSPNAPPLSFIIWKIFEASGCNFHEVSPELGLESVRLGMGMAQSTGVHVVDSPLLAQGVISALTGGDLSLARDFLDRMASCAKGRSERGHYHYLASWHAFLNGDIPGSLMHAEESAGLLVESGMPFGEAVARRALARVLFQLGRHREAVSHLRVARRIALRTGSAVLEYACHLTEALFALAGEGQTLSAKASADALRKGLALGRAQGFANTSWWVPSDMTKLCLKALEEGIEVEYIRMLVRKRCISPDEPPYHCENWPWKIRIFTLGRFEIVKEDEPLHYPVRAPRVPLTLLKAIVAIGSGGVREDQLVDSLWPYADGDTAHQTLKTTLDRLRHLIGDEGAVRVREGRVTLDQRSCWVDAWAFERMVDEALRSAEFEAFSPNTGRGSQPGKGLPSHGPQSGIPQRLEKALQLYCGHFLPGEEGYPWAVSLQERLRHKYLRAVSFLCSHWENSGQFAKAIECYHKGLEVDDLAEELYQRVMLCHEKLGRKADAVRAYRRCRDMLKTNLGVEPSQETEEIYRSLTGTGPGQGT